MPDFDPPEEVKDAACRAIRDGYNQYSITWGVPALRQAIAAKARAFNAIECDADRHITVCCGATECMMATMLALIDQGTRSSSFSHSTRTTPPMRSSPGRGRCGCRCDPPDWRFDPDELRAAFSPRTGPIIVNTPNNPTGSVFTRGELTQIAELCQEFNAFALSDEIYEYIRYGDVPHISIATLPGMAERTVTISGLSKTFSMTGWRLGYCIAPAAITDGIRKVARFSHRRCAASAASGRRGGVGHAAIVLRFVARRLPARP